LVFEYGHLELNIKLIEKKMLERCFNIKDEA